MVRCCKYNFLNTEISGAGECENGWVAYKDELCLKAFPDLLSYNEAKLFCAHVSGSLVMVKEPEIQNMLANYTHDIFDNLWLGGRYDNQSAIFKWEDGEPLTYTNWQESYPKNTTDSCIELRPPEVKSSTYAAGKWADVTCQKRNLVICQRTFSWSLEDAVKEIVRIRKELQEEKENLREKFAELQEENQRLREKDEALQEESNSLKEYLDQVNSKVVPVGSIYIEYYGQPSPEQVWPTLSWQDISSTYAGLFFRVLGGNSENWGSMQTDCAPRITQIALGLMDSDNGAYTNPVDIPASGWSEFGAAGEIYFSDPSHKYYEGQRFHTSACEVRPTNQAIRLWKRIE